jgi:hypothetical protein
VPGLAALGSRASGIAFVFCGQTNKCIGIGGYMARAGLVKGHLFVVAQADHSDLRRAGGCRPVRAW